MPHEHGFGDKCNTGKVGFVQDEDMELQQSNGEAGTSGRDHAADLAGTLYETVLLAILEGLRLAKHAWLC